MSKDNKTNKTPNGRGYLKLGAEAHSRARQAKSTAAYTSRKKMVTMLAMVLSFPANSTSCRERKNNRRCEKKNQEGKINIQKHFFQIQMKHKHLALKFHVGLKWKSHYANPFERFLKCMFKVLKPISEYLLNGSFLDFDQIKDIHVLTVLETLVSSQKHPNKAQCSMTNMTL